MVDDSAEGLKKTKGALALLVKVGAIADAEKAKASRNIRCEWRRSSPKCSTAGQKGWLQVAGHSCQWCCRCAVPFKIDSGVLQV